MPKLPVHSATVTALGLEGDRYRERDLSKRQETATDRLDELGAFDAAYPAFGRTNQPEYNPQRANPGSPSS